MAGFQKLVRDKIPEIMRQNGQTPITRTLGEAEYRRELDRKLTEEVNEYLESGELEELADILEVLFAIAAAQGAAAETLLETAKNKREERGGFSDRTYLVGKE